MLSWPLGRVYPIINLNMVGKNLAVVRTASWSIIRAQAGDVHRLVGGPANLAVESAAVEHLRERLCHRERAAPSQHRERGANWNDGDTTRVSQRLQHRLDECHWPLGHRQAKTKKSLSPPCSGNHSDDKLVGH